MKYISLKNFLHDIRESFFHLFFPRLCAGCGTDLPSALTGLCVKCLAGLAETGFEPLAGNPVEKKFWGRLPLEAASASYYFRRETLIQHLMHRFKYGGDRELCLQLGRLMGRKLADSGRFKADLLIPLPLFPEKERIRGFNQARLLCDGMSEQMEIPVSANLVIRRRNTATQTRKTRLERWQNMENIFGIPNPSCLAHKKLVLVDDVVTTGATLEACGQEILRAPDVTLSISTLCYAAQV